MKGKLVRKRVSAVEVQCIRLQFYCYITLLAIDEGFECRIARRWGIHVLIKVTLLVLPSYG